MIVVGEARKENKKQFRRCLERTKHILETKSEEDEKKLFIIGNNNESRLQNAVIATSED